MQAKDFVRRNQFRHWNNQLASSYSSQVLIQVQSKVLVQESMQDQKKSIIQESKSAWQAIDWSRESCWLFSKSFLSYFSSFHELAQRNVLDHCVKSKISCKKNTFVQGGLLNRSSDLNHHFLHVHMKWSSEALRIV